VTRKNPLDKILANGKVVQAAFLLDGQFRLPLEDSIGDASRTLFSVKDQEARIAAARSTAERRCLSLVINARTDTFLLALGADLEERVKMTVERGRAYLQAGAVLCLFPR
jgi:2-methylisocitrate lyase-like PEP mutase family enzyme